MKVRLFASCFFTMMLLFMTSCNNEDLTSTLDSNSLETKSVLDKNYVFAVKPSAAQTRAVAPDTRKYWTAGETILVKFLNGTTIAKQRVEEYAKIWEKYANIKFDFIASGDADVKIQFGKDGDNTSWSSIGTDCQDVSQDEASMQIINFSDELIDGSLKYGDAREDLRAIVLREFGHVLGLGFEHQNGDYSNSHGYAFTDDENIDYEAAVAYLVRQGWTDFEAEDMLEPYSSRRVEEGRFDENSIMMIYFPPYLTVNNEGAGKWNLFLSKGDIAFIGKVYPFPKTKLSITYAAEGNANSYEYEAVRIGEYLWLDCNLHSPVGIVPTKEALSRALVRLGADPNSYLISMEDLNRYYGTYYNRYHIEGKIVSPTVYEYDRDGNKNLVAGWDMQGAGAFEQLLAMCGNGSKADVRKYLGAKAGDNPVAYNPTGINWFDGNENIYGYNLMPGGGLYNGPQDDGQGAGDMNAIFRDDRLIGHETTFVIAPTYAHPRFTIKLWHWMHVRYNRPLTDEELGYKLYVNGDKTDIVKKSLTETAPAGYTELPKGYLRGFYVQYILDNPYPEKTINEIVGLANLMTNNSNY